MAFPTVPTAGNGRILAQFQANTTAARTFPSLSSLTKNSGDLLIAVAVAYQRSAAGATFGSWGGGFTELVDRDGGTSTTMAVGIATKVSTGSETGTFTVTQAATVTGHVGLFVMAIEGWHGTTPPEVTALAVGTTTIADPAALNPGGWAAEDTLWISVAGCGETGTGGAFTGMGAASGGLGPPTGYDDEIGTGESADAIGAVGSAVAFRQNNTASEDVGAWTNVDVSNARNCALVIAVRPAAEVAQEEATSPVDDLDVTDSVDLLITRLIDLDPDDVGIVDSTVVVKGANVAPVDPVGIADDAVVEVPAGADTVEPTDPVGIVDTLAATADHVIEPADPVGVTDTAAPVKSLDIVKVDPVGVTDSAVPAVTRHLAPVDPVGITEDVDLVHDHIVEDDPDTVGITDTAVVVKSLSISPTDTVGITDSTVLEADYVTNPVDNVGIVDTAAVIEQGAGAVSPTDPVGIVDSVEHSGIYIREHVDPVGIVDTAAVVKSLSVAPTDNVGIVDSATQQGTYVRAFTDPVGVTDSAAVVKQGAGAVSPTDPVGVTDSVVLVVARVINPVDVVGIADTAVAAKTIALQIVEQLGVTDSIQHTAIYFREHVDTVGITDTIAAPPDLAPVAITLRAARHTVTATTGQATVMMTAARHATME